jgi:formate hydrogenlyase transcriptional activator
VLILGETGIGKELIARAIHRLSHRRERRFVTINCAAIPTGLFESELFGHEKGAFTGALTQKIGRLELADGGTLLLDEVGDILPELQPKLLRVLQDGEFERLGSMQTNRVNVRLITATNRDLSEKLAEGTFRRDLFYRLNVFPLQMPTLRERREDIPMLVRHFVRKFSDKGDQTIKTIPQSMMRALQQWNWRGNVRELEHFIHRAVIMTKGTVLYDCLPDPVTVGPERVDRTLKAVERDHILEVLRGAGGKLAGKWGAATKLGLKRTTLQSKMRKLGIQRSDYDPNNGTG